MSTLQTIGADALHSQGVRGSGVGVAIIDTGVSPVGSLAGRLKGGIGLCPEATTDDRYGHGTFLAGLVAQVAPDAHVVPVRIADDEGITDVSNVLAALQWVVAHRDEFAIRVVNLSFGTDSPRPWNADVLNYAVQRTLEAGVSVVVSVANRGPNPRTVTKPADDPWVIAVGATDTHGNADRGDDELADFSSRGPIAGQPIAGTRAKPDLVAPGVKLTSQRLPGSVIEQRFPASRIDANTTRGSGTSFAAAVVSGAVALLRSAHPDWTPNQVKSALVETAGPAAFRRENATGAGTVDVAAAADVVNPALGTVPAPNGNGLKLGPARGSVTIKLTGNGKKLGQNEETTAQGRPFDAGEFGGPWQGMQWQGMQWQGMQWQGMQWQGMQWQGAWYGDSWG